MHDSRYNLERENFMKSNTIADYKIRPMQLADNQAVAALVRVNLENNGLDIAGTAYFDSTLDNLYEFYSMKEGRGYYVLADDSDSVVGGIGFAEFEPFESCAELQKLYLADSAKGSGLGYRLVAFVEERMQEAGYKASYLETHHNLQTAIHIYEKMGYSKIERPKEVAHGTMDHFYYKKLSD